mmetsp:Transcript_115849/g.327795  ORF Transcript_115849/g.327795 Transcript_115849/m.327795 type:complete len:241 (-) Transcript_115849:873-1595(-)
MGHALQSDEARLRRIPVVVIGKICQLALRVGNSVALAQYGIGEHADHHEWLGVAVLWRHHEQRFDAALLLGESECVNRLCLHGRHLIVRVVVVILIIVLVGRRGHLICDGIPSVNCPLGEIRLTSEGELHAAIAALGADDHVHVGEQRPLHHGGLHYWPRWLVAGRLQFLVLLETLHHARKQYSASEIVRLWLLACRRDGRHVGNLLGIPAVEVEPSRRQGIIPKLTERDETLREHFVWR